MDKKKYEITENIFGGYNKKKTDDYIETLQNMTESMLARLPSLEAENLRLEKTVSMAETYYKALWECNKGQEKLIESQKEFVATQNKSLAKQYEVIEKLITTCKAITTEEGNEGITEVEKRKKKKKNKKEKDGSKVKENQEEERSENAKEKISSIISAIDLYGCYYDARNPWIGARTSSAR